jgi:putative heme-binding domain-containing protein
VGPGLESIGASAPVDYLIDSLLLPGKKVKEGYQALTAATNDGRILTGIKLRDNERELLLRDSEGREISIPTPSIEEKKDAGSLMPVGLTETLTQGEFLDLARFLSELGKVGPYSVSKDRVVRRWQVLQDDPQAGRKILYLRGNFGGKKLDEAGMTWLPAYSTVSGSLPRTDIPELNGMKSIESHKPSRIVRCEIEVTTGGEVGFRHNASKFPGPVRHALWIDDGADTPFAEQRVKLAPGIHTLTFLLEDGEGPPLKVELFDVPGSPAKVQPVLGR